MNLRDRARRRQLSTASAGLAYALLDGEWKYRLMLARCERALGAKPDWLPPFCRRVRRRFRKRPDGSLALRRFIARAEPWRNPRGQGSVPQIRSWCFPPTHMVSVAGPPARFAVPALDTLGALQELLALSPEQLAWLADSSRRNAARVDPRLRHYHYRWLGKRSGGHRLLETPKPRLKALQRKLLTQLIAHLPPSAAAHGFVPERSVLSFVSAHVGQRIVVRLDLESFFSSIRLPRVRAIFRRVGYPYAVAQELAALCCVPTPEDVIAAQPRTSGNPDERRAQTLTLRSAHLPQGAPTSPALSNLVTFRLDRRLEGLARAYGVRYTRYADDLAFSGDRRFERAVSDFIARVAAIVLSEGFRVRYRKTRVMRAGKQQKLAGLVVNERVNVPRAEFDALRALLHNAARSGPASQNRQQLPDFRAHLTGRIAWVDATNPRRGARLKRLFERIDWTRDEPAPRA